MALNDLKPIKIIFVFVNNILNGSDYWFNYNDNKGLSKNKKK
jgi:hypothetical protein